MGGLGDREDEDRWNQVRGGWKDQTLRETSGIRDGESQGRARNLAHWQYPLFYKGDPS